MFKFKAELAIIGVNPYVFVPEPILNSLFTLAGKRAGNIPIHGKINGKEFQQTLVKYNGFWRLYVNTNMLKNSPKRIGEEVDFEIHFDPSDRSIPMPEQLQLALDLHPDAKAVFLALSPSRKNEIVRYIARLKSPEILEKNINRAISFLQGKERFVGREKP